jgi:hypothetical protein
MGVQCRCTNKGYAGRAATRRPRPAADREMLTADEIGRLDAAAALIADRPTA